jgi:hypothetical protein
MYFAERYFDLIIFNAYLQELRAQNVEPGNTKPSPKPLSKIEREVSDQSMPWKIKLNFSAWIEMQPEIKMIREDIGLKPKKA